MSEPGDSGRKWTRKPTHILRVKERGGEGKTTIGVGWSNSDGSINIKLGPCVTLRSTDDVIIKLFPNDRR